jgi:hypothetical protein
MPWKLARDYNMADFQAKIWRGSYCYSKLVLLFQTYNIILYVHSFLFCWHFSYRTCAFCKARSDWLQLPLAALHINRHCVTLKIRLMMPRVKMSRADRNPWLAKMVKIRFSRVNSRNKGIFYSHFGLTTLNKCFQNQIHFYLPFKM